MSAFASAIVNRATNESIFWTHRIECGGKDEVEEDEVEEEEDDMICKNEIEEIEKVGRISKNESEEIGIEIKSDKDQE